MKTLLLISILISFSANTFCQTIKLVKDSIMQSYMESGFATKQFRPEGKIDSNQLRQGKWFDYEVTNEASFQLEKNIPMKTFSKYLLYGEGNFVSNKRNGPWNIYVIQDKSYKKILSKKVFYENGVMTGRFEYYFPDGKLAQNGTYIDEQIQGYAEIYFPDHAIYGKQHYINNEKDGEQNYFYANGSTELIITYSNGKKDGKYQLFYKNGKLQESITYKQDKIDSTYRYNYSNGQLWTEKFYKNGQLFNVVATFDKNGKKLEPGTLKDGNGTVIFYTEDSKIYSIETYKEGNKIDEKSY